MSRAVVIRDAVWGDVELDGALTDLLGAAELQRQRGVRQLGTAHLVYPSANHTRFEHQLGTCHVAGRILRALRERGHPCDAEQEAVVRAAALVHDVGHVPFGHTFEDERRIFPRHDGEARMAHFLGEGTDLGRRLARHGLAEGVRAALGEGGPPSLARDVVGGTICADLLDYLARDARATGIRREYDERVFRYFAVRDDRLVLCLSKRGLRRADAFSEVIHLLRLRYTLSERVYFHHAKVASGALVSKLVERASGLGLELPDLYPLGDEGLLELLARTYAPRDPVVARLLDDFRARRLPKRAYVLTRGVGLAEQAELVRRFHHDRAARERVEAELEAELGLEPGAVILYCPAADMALKEADIPVELDGVQSLNALGVREVDALCEQHRDLWRFTVLLEARSSDRASRLAEACADRFGRPSELQLGPG
ncbi:MAG: HD domain-containing protein [Planctomycetes bacterium]|nr:HD domain-containing protein [Planctomycetota bacterium]